MTSQLINAARGGNTQRCKAQTSDFGRMTNISFRWPSKLCLSSQSCLLLLSGIFVVPLFSTCQQHKQPDIQHEPDTGPFTRESADPEQEQQIKADSRAISIRLANLFHYKFVTSCMQHIPDNLQVQYGGHLGTDSGRLGQRFNDSEVTLFLEWDVHGDLVVFSFRISTKPTKHTLAKCQVDNTELFVEANFVDKNRPVDEKLPELGGLSVKEVLLYLEREPVPAAQK